jgi:hypothetical protein
MIVVADASVLVGELPCMRGCELPILIGICPEPLCVGRDLGFHIGRVAFQRSAHSLKDDLATKQTSTLLKTAS